MAQTYANTPVLSKIKIGSNYYYLKDADLRSIVDGFNNDIVTGTIGGMTENNKFVYSQNIKAYVDAAVADAGHITYEIVSSLPTASATALHKIYLVSKGTGKTGYKEWICLDLGATADPRYQFEEIGDTDVDFSDYYNKSTIDTKLDAKEDKANLGDLAYKDSAAGTYGGTTISGVKATGNLDFSLSGALQYDSTAVNSSGSYTPAGTVSAKSTDGSFSALKSATFQADATNGVQITGEVSKPDVSITPSSDSVLGSIKTAGTVATFTQGAKAQLTDQTTSKFAKSGVTATIGTGSDAECLIFADATTADAVTDRGTFTENGDDTFNGGNMPEYNTATVLTGVSAALASAPTFTGAKYSINTTADTALKNVEFSGTQATVSVSGNYDKANIGTVDVAAKDVELSVGDISVPAADITVQ